jgi:hypothetical protein
MSNEAFIKAPPQVEMAFSQLDGHSHITVKQKVSKIEAITAMMGDEFERPNKYKIVDERDHEIFFAQEMTGCCRRQLMATGLGPCMSWEVRFFHTAGGNREHVFDLHKPWQLSFCCINQPKAFLQDPDGTHFGYMQEPCCCASMCPKYTVHGPNDETLIVAKSSPCQLGLWFPMPCGPCSRIEFDMADADGNNLGKVTKKIPCGKCCCAFLAPGQDVDYYHVDLTALRSAHMKALVMALTVFIDFRMMAKEEDEEHHKDDQGGDGQ